MTGLLRRATLLAAGAVLIAAEGMASVPNAANSTQPTPRVIRIGGRSNPGDYTGVVTYTVRNGDPGGGVAIENCPVTLNFTGCADVMLCTNAADCPAFQEPAPNPPYDEPGCVDCAAKTVTGFTNAAGQVTFVVVGASIHPAAPVEIGPCVTVRAGTPPNDVALDPLTAATADYNGVSGVNAVDLGVFGADLFSVPPNWARSDHNGTGDVNAVDLGLFAAFLFGGLSPCSCTDPGDACADLVDCAPGM